MRPSTTTSPAKSAKSASSPASRSTTEDTTITVAGVSCRQQIEHFTGRPVKHIAEVLAEQVKPGHRWVPAEERDGEMVAD